MEEEIRTVRTPKTGDRPYFSMARETAQDNRLSWEARGVLAYLLSKPDDWQVMIADLQQNCGRDRVKKILKELEDCCYLKIHRRQHGESGKFTHNEYQVYEVPFTENPSTAKPSTANPHLHIKELQSTELKDIGAGAPDSPKADPIPTAVCVPETTPAVKKKTRQPDPLFDAIREVWKINAGGYIGSMKAMMLGIARTGQWKLCNFDPPATAEEVLAFKGYAEKRMAEKGITDIPTAACTIQRWFYDMRATVNHPVSVLDKVILH